MATKSTSSVGEKTASSPRRTWPNTGSSMMISCCPAEQEIRGVPDPNWKTAAGRWKADICRRLQIDILFEDMPEVVNVVEPTDDIDAR